MHYTHEGSWVIVCISRAPDVTLYEAMNFLERFKESFTRDNIEDLDQLQTEDAPQMFKKHKSKVCELISKWNADPVNRDQTYIIF
jgi:hypothetical protein